MIVGAAIAVVLAIAVMCFVVTAVGSFVVARRYPPTGRFAVIDGLRLHYIDEGEPSGLPPIVFIHGASASLEGARSALRFAFGGRRVVWLDRPGHGHSGRAGGGADTSAPAVQAKLIAGLMDALAIERAVIVAHSLGGSVAAALAVTHPSRVAGLVFVAPATHTWPGGITWYYTVSTLPLIGRLFAWTLVFPVAALILDPVMRGVFAPDPMPPDYRQAARVPLVLRPGNFLANARDVANLKDNVIQMQPRYREITAPTVIVTGDADSVVWPHLHSEGLKRDIEGAELIALPGIGHMPHHVRPDIVAAAVEQVTERAMA